MKWYEILGLIVLVIVGAILRSKFNEYKSDFFSGHNGSWRDRKK